MTNKLYTIVCKCVFDAFILFILPEAVLYTMKLLYGGYLRSHFKQERHRGGGIVLVVYCCLPPIRQRADRRGSQRTAVE